MSDFPGLDRYTEVIKSGIQGVYDRISALEQVTINNKKTNEEWFAHLNAKLAALESILVDNGIISQDEMNTRYEGYLKLEKARIARAQEKLEKQLEGESE